MPLMQTGERRDRVTADLENVAAEEAAMRNAMLSGTHRMLVPQVQVTEAVRADMKWFYENRLRDSRDGSEVWGEIVSLAGRLCPFCHLTKPRTVEHSYPQSTYPRLAVEPWNLVPACRDCNSERNVGHGSITISPYVDAWAARIPWLTARVIDPCHPADLQFEVFRNPSLTPDQYAALLEFVKDVNLLDRYVGLAIEAFEEFVASMRLADPTPTAAIAEQNLIDKVQSHLLAFGVNRWQTASFEAWHRSARSIDWSRV